MNFTNEEKLQNNNMGIRSLNFNNNMKVPRRKQKLTSEKSNPEIVEFKSQDNLIFLKNSQPIQNAEPYLKKDRNKEKNNYMIQTTEIQILIMIIIYHNNQINQIVQ